MEINRTFMQPSDQALLETRGNLAEVLVGLGDCEAAEAERRAIIAAIEPSADPHSPWLALNRIRLAHVLLKRGKGGCSRGPRLAGEASWVRRIGGASRHRTRHLELCFVP